MAAPATGITLSALIGLSVVYLGWLKIVEKMHERESRIRGAIKGERYAKGGITFEVSRLTIQERTGKTYRFRKYIPFVRKLNGDTEVTLRSKSAEISLRADGIGFGDYFWKRQSIDEYLGSELPKVDYLGTDSVGDTSETKLKIHSVDLPMIQKTLEEVPMYLKGILDEYPGEANIRKFD